MFENVCYSGLGIDVYGWGLWLGKLGTFEPTVGEV